MNYLIDVMPQLLQGANDNTEIICFYHIRLIAAGILLSFGLASKFKPLQWILRFYVWIMRGTPLLLQLIFVFYGLPLVGIIFDRFDARCLLCIELSHYAEIFRGGFNRFQLANMKHRR